MNPVVFIPLTQGRVAVVDFDDFHLVRGFKWCAINNGHRTYAARRTPRDTTGRQKSIFMHREVLGLGFGNPLEGDHRNGDGLDNQRGNLRKATTAQNQQGFRTKPAGTKSQFRGVSFHKRDRKWYSLILVKGRRIYLGYAPSEEDAARAYDAAARKYYGEFANLNFP